ncbi:RasGAP protein, partial [Coemansia sp. RSA 2603]
AARRRFPQADDAQAYSLVGGIFFLRYVNAALLSPTQYGLLDEPPSAPVRSNLKLVARLLQRLSNNWGKPADEWPVDARKFVRSNARRFGLFLASLTDSEQAAGSASPAPGWPAGRGCLSVPRNIECDRWCKGKGRRREWRDPGTRVRQCVTDQGPSRTPVVRRRAATKPDRVVASSAGIKQGSPASSSSGNSASTGCSTHSMFDMSSPARVTEAPSSDIVVPLNDLYILQKYLELYSDAWALEEHAHVQADEPVTMQACLHELGPVPSLVPSQSNHPTRIKVQRL